MGTTCEVGFRDLSVSAMIGVYESELQSRQELFISVAMKYDSNGAGVFLLADDLSNAMDYQSAADYVKSECLVRRFGLIEHMGAFFCKALLAMNPVCASVCVEIKKPQAVPGSAGSFCIYVEDRGIPSL